MTHVWSISYLDADGVISFRVERQIEPFVVGGESSNSKEHGTSCHDQHYPHQKRVVTPENGTLYIAVFHSFERPFPSVTMQCLCNKACQDLFAPKTSYPKTSKSTLEIESILYLYHLYFRNQNISSGVELTSKYLAVCSALLGCASV